MTRADDRAIAGAVSSVAQAADMARWDYLGDSASIRPRFERQTDSVIDTTTVRTINDAATQLSRTVIVLEKADAPVDAVTRARTIQSSLGPAVQQLRLQIADAAARNRHFLASERVRNEAALVEEQGQIVQMAAQRTEEFKRRVEDLRRTARRSFPLSFRRLRANAQARREHARLRRDMSLARNRIGASADRHTNIVVAQANQLDAQFDNQVAVARDELLSSIDGFQAEAAQLLTEYGVSYTVELTPLQMPSVEPPSVGPELGIGFS